MKSTCSEFAKWRQEARTVKSRHIPALRQPIKTLLDERIAELHAEWVRFNNDFTQGGSSQEGTKFPGTC